VKDVTYAIPATPAYQELVGVMTTLILLVIGAAVNLARSVVTLILKGLKSSATLLKASMICASFIVAGKQEKGVPKFHMELLTL